ncbi:MAG: twin-arginine translocase TatA/TatE family subunit [Candidatus Sumerlaeaceae bacterium]
MPNIGPFEMIIVFLIVLIIFGPKALPKIGQALGKGIREFKDAARGLTSDEDERQQPRPVITQPVTHDAIPAPVENHTGTPQA